RRAGLHVEPPAGGARGGRRADRIRGRRRAARGRAWVAASPRRPEPLLLEEREVAPRPGAPYDRPARLLGAVRLPQRRGLLEGRALRLLALRRKPSGDSRPNAFC